MCSAIRRGQFNLGEWGTGGGGIAVIGQAKQSRDRTAHLDETDRLITDQILAKRGQRNDAQPSSRGWHTGETACKAERTHPCLYRGGKKEGQTVSARQIDPDPLLHAISSRRGVARLQRKSPVEWKEQRLLLLPTRKAASGAIGLIWDSVGGYIEPMGDSSRACKTIRHALVLVQPRRTRNEQPTCYFQTPTKASRNTTYLDLCGTGGETRPILKP